MSGDIDPEMKKLGTNTVEFFEHNIRFEPPKITEHLESHWVLFSPAIIADL